jgi:hypothetical protein
VHSDDEAVDDKPSTEEQQRPSSPRGWIYLLAWLLGIFLVVAADHTQPLWLSALSGPAAARTEVAQGPTSSGGNSSGTAIGSASALQSSAAQIRLTSGVKDDRPDWLPIIGPRVGNELAQIVSWLSLQLVPWTALVGFAWLYGKRRWTDQDVWQDVVRYVGVWTVGVVVLVSWQNKWLTDSLSEIEPALINATRPLPLILSWSAAIIFVYVILGDRSRTYRNYVRAYRGVWCSLIATLTVAIVGSIFVYDTVDHRVQGLLVARGLAAASLTDIAEASTRMSLRVKALRSDVDAYPEVSRAAAEGPPQERIRANLVDGVATVIAQLQGDVVRAEDSKRVAEAQIQVAMQLDGSGSGLTPMRSRDTGMSLEPINSALAKFSPPTLQIKLALLELEKERQAVAAEDSRPVSRMLAIVDRDLIPQVAAMETTSHLVADAMSSVGAVALAFYLWAGAFFAVVIFLPWMLVLLFLFRKRLARASQIRDDLTMLDPIKLRPLRRVLNSTRAERSHEHPQPDDLTPQSELDSSIEEVANRAFSNFDYLVNLFVLTLLLTVGLYYVFYPDTITGVAVLVERGGSVSDINEYFTEKLAPLTLGFAGAYFWLLQALLRRYFAGDLYPTVLLQACVRLLIVFLLSLLLGNAAAFSGWDARLLGVLAFFAGIVPNAVVQGLGMKITRATGIEFVTKQDAPLTRLNGLTIWSESRLFEENIENIYAMAKSSMEQLVLRTHFPTGLIVEWVDQAILYTHAGEQGRWFDALRSAGIGSASELLAVAGWPIYELPPEVLGDRKPDPTALGRISAAVSFAQRTREDKDSAEVAQARQSLEEFRCSAGDIPPRIDTAQEMLRSIELARRESFDHVAALWRQVEIARRATLDAKVPVQQVLMLVGIIAGSATDNDGVSLETRMTDADKSMREAIDLVNDAEQWMPSKAPGVTEPGRIELAASKTNTWRSHLMAVQAAVGAVLAASVGNGGSRAPHSVADDAAAADAAIKAALVPVEAASIVAGRLDPADPASLNALESLNRQLADVATRAEAVVTARKGAEQKVKNVPHEGSTWESVKSLVARSTQQSDELSKAVGGVKDALAGLAAPNAAENPAADQTLRKAQMQIVQADQAARATVDAAEQALAGLESATGKVLVSSDLLHVMCQAIWRDPNLEYVVNYKKQVASGEQVRLTVGVPAPWASSSAAPSRPSSVSILPGPVSAVVARPPENLGQRIRRVASSVMLGA